MIHVIAAAILTIGTLSPCFFCVAIAHTIVKRSEEARQIFLQWLSMVSGCILTVIISFLLYCVG